MKHSRAARLLNDMGMTWQHLGQHQKAVEHLNQALAICNELYGPEHPLVGMILNNFGAVYYLEGETDQAIEEFNKALAIFRKRADKNNTASMLVNLGGFFAGKGNSALAINYLQEALVILRDIYGKTHPQIRNVLLNLADILMEERRFLEAIDCYEWTLLNLIKFYGEEDTRVVECLNTLGRIYSLNLYQPREAIGHFERALSITRRMHGELHRDVFSFLYNIGIISSIVGDIPKAKDYLTQAHQLGLRLPDFGSNHPDIVNCKHELDLVLEEEGHDELNDSDIDVEHLLDSVLEEEGLEEINIQLNDSDLDIERKRYLISKKKDHHELNESEPLLGSKEEGCCCTIS